jgi:uncharacterized protein
MNPRIAAGVTPAPEGITVRAMLLAATTVRFARRPPSRPRLRLAAVLSFFFVFFTSLVASAAEFRPPPLRGHVVDEAGALSEAEVRKLDKKLDRTRKQTGFAIVVYLLPKLPDGLTIEDVGYAAGNAWGVGSKTGDDGVLLIASLGDRKLRIETGKGVGGALTDIESSRINREVIGPPLTEGRTYEAVDKGIDAIVKELVANTPGGVSDPGRDPSASRGGKHPSAPSATPPPRTTGDYLKLGAIAIVILGVIVLAIISPGFREVLFWILLFGRFGGGGGGGGGRRDDDDDGGSGYGGGGGSFGGGGSSDDY